MVDTVNATTRSLMMSAIKGINTRPEMCVRRYLHAAGLRYRLHDRELPGKPDLVFPRNRVAVFVHGCFWHQHSMCKYATMPASNVDFWNRKFAANVGRDKLTREQLTDMGWTVLTIWECETENAERLDELFWQIVSNDKPN